MTRDTPLNGKVAQDVIKLKETEGNKRLSVFLPMQ